MIYTVPKDMVIFAGCPGDSISIQAAKDYIAHYGLTFDDVTLKGNENGVKVTAKRQFVLRPANIKAAQKVLAENKERAEASGSLYPEIITQKETGNDEEKTDDQGSDDNSKDE